MGKFCQSHRPSLYRGFIVSFREEKTIIIIIIIIIIINDDDDDDYYYFKTGEFKGPPTQVFSAFCF